MTIDMIGNNSIYFNRDTDAEVIVRTDHIKVIRREIRDFGDGPQYGIRMTMADGTDHTIWNSQLTAFNAGPVTAFTNDTAGVTTMMGFILQEMAV